MSSVAVQLQVQGRRCLVVGGGEVGARRAAALQTAGARTTVVAPIITPALTTLAEDGALRVQLREFLVTDLDPEGVDRVLLVVTATDDAAVNEEVARIAGAHGVLVNRADDATQGDLTFPPNVQRGSVTIAVSSGVPTASRWIVERLGDRLDEVLGLDADGLDRLVEVLSEVRDGLRRSGAPSGGSPGSGERGVTVGPADWRSALDGSILELVHQGRTAEAKERLLACLSS